MQLNSLTNSTNFQHNTMDINDNGASDLIAAAAAVEQDQPPSKIPKLNVDINQDDTNNNNVASAPDYMDIDTAQANDTEDYGIPPLSPVVNPELQGEDNVGNFKTEGDEEGMDVSGGGGKKQRKHKEFTAEEKLKIIGELDARGDNTSVQELLDKHGASRSSVHRWTRPAMLQSLKALVKEGKGSGKRDSSSTTSTTDSKKRKRDTTDKLSRIKLGLQEFCKDNMNKPEEEQLAITSGLIRVKAHEIKADLLKTPNLLSKEEISGLNSFKGSKSWGCVMGNELGYLSAASAPKWSAKAKKNTTSYIEQHTSDDQTKAKKKRTEFTAQEKLAILNELENTNIEKKSEKKKAMTVEEICTKYSTSKSSLHRWKQMHRSGRLQQLAAANSGHATSKRVSSDKYQMIRMALNGIYLENENLPLDQKTVLTYDTLQSHAIAVKDSLLEKHNAAVSASQGKTGDGDQDEDVNSADMLSTDEVIALKNFKASHGWLRESAKKFHWHLDGDSGVKRSGSLADEPGIVHHPGIDQNAMEEVQDQMAIEAQGYEGEAAANQDGFPEPLEQIKI